jgi:hypothetical protein
LLQQLQLLISCQVYWPKAVCDGLLLLVLCLLLLLLLLEV